MKVLEQVNEEVLPSCDKPLVGTLHPGFAFVENKNGPSNEVSPLSTAYISPNKYNNKYIAGGFNGGLTSEFVNMAKILDRNINIDKNKDIMAKWHDESHLNKFMNLHETKFKFLNSDYCYPENFYMDIPGKPKILALDKKHHIIRTTTEKNKLLIHPMGGLGNLLFQIAHAYDIAIKNNLEVIIDLNTQDEKRVSSLKYHIFDNFFRGNFEFDEKYFKIEEKNKCFYNIDIPKNKDIFLFGFFQSSLFFKDTIEKLKKKLNFYLKPLAEEIYNKIKKRFLTKNLVAIHIRGDDYLQLKNYHYNLTKNYYINCQEKLDNIYKNNFYILFTDDYEYCLQNFGRYYDTTIKSLIEEYIDNKNNYLVNNPELELLILSCFSNIISSNSTFSLWGSYLSNANNIYIPSRWFGKDGPKDFKLKELCLNDKYKILKCL